jgi:mono/diheme cytochrome c family protein
MKLFLALLLAAALTPGAARAQQKKPTPKPKPAAAVGVPAARLAAGKAIYVQNCLTCHMADGGGVEGMNPPLTQTTWVLGDKFRLAKVVLKGLQDQDIDGEPYRNVMPAFDYLTDQQIADVLTYVRNSFGNKAPALSSGEVKAARLK